MRQNHKKIFRGLMVSIFFCLFVLRVPGWAKAYLGEYDEENYASNAVSVASTGPLFTQDWDWEAVNEVQYELNGVVGTVALPWVQGAATDIPMDIAYDHKKSDGWVLLYNFMDGELKDRGGQPVDIDYPVSFFALYNKYRGIVRFFYFHTNEKSYTDFVYGLIMETSGDTTLLNFAGEFSKPDDEPLRDPSLQRANIKMFGTSGPIYKHWHYFDVELTYDPQILKKSWADVQIRWLGRGADTQKLKADGRIENGKILGRVDLAGSNTDLEILGSLTFNTGRVDNFNTSINIDQAGTASAQVAAKAEKQQDSFLKAELQKLAKQLLQKGLNGIKDFAVSKLTKLFNSFIGGSNNSNDSPKDNVNLRFEADIHLTGTMTLEEPVFKQTLKVPGTGYTDAASVIVPFYDLPLGVLTISTTPEVIWEEWFEYGLYGNEFCYLQGYRLNVDSFDVILNPAVEKELRIKSVQNFVYYYQIYKGATPLVGILGRFPDYVGAILVDSDPDHTIYEGSTALFTVYRNVYPIPYQDWENGSTTNGVDQKVVVRIVVELERRDDPTADPIVWSKTFLPKFTHDTSQNPVRYIDPFVEIFPR